MDSLLFIMLSAALYLLGMMLPAFCLVGMTTFLIPLMLLPRVSWRHGFIWGMVTFGIHTSWILILMHQKALGMQGYLFWVLLVLWLSSISAVWFYFFTKYPAVSTVLFFIFMTKYSLIIGGVVDGYPLCNPMVVLAQYPSLLYSLYWLHDVGYLVVLCGVQVAAVTFYRTPTKSSLTFIALSLFIFLSGLVLQKTDTDAPKIKIGVVCPWWHNSKDPMFAGYRMAHDLSVVAQKHQNLEAIILPESSFCWNLYEYDRFFSIWSESAAEVPIILGSHCLEGAITHNCAFLLHNGILAAKYCKQHKMPLVERSLYVEQWIGSLLMLHQRESAGVLPSNSDEWVIGNCTYQIFICSELFFESKKVKGVPILLLWNDTWLCVDWMRNVARLFIRYFEQKHRVRVYHVSTLGHHNLECCDESSRNLYRYNKENNA